MARSKMNQEDKKRAHDIGDNINNLLLKKGMTKKDLSNSLGIPYSSTLDYLTGKTLMPLGILQKVSLILDVPKSDIDPIFSGFKISTAAEIKKSFSDNLSFYMKKHNLTNKEIAGITGVREKKVEQWLTGESNPRLPALQNMAEYFGVTVHELISGTPIKSADDVIKNMLLSKEVSEKIGYDPNSLDDERIEDITEALVSFLKLTVK